MAPPIAWTYLAGQGWEEDHVAYNHSDMASLEAAVQSTALLIFDTVDASTLRRNVGLSGAVVGLFVVGHFRGLAAVLAVLCHGDSAS